MEARYYNAQWGRFLSQDPVFLEIGLNPDLSQLLQDPQALNSYAYARNNPLKYIDPDGKFFTRFSKQEITKYEKAYATQFAPWCSPRYNTYLQERSYMAGSVNSGSLLDMALDTPEDQAARAALINYKGVDVSKFSDEDFYNNAMALERAHNDKMTNLVIGFSGGIKIVGKLGNVGTKVVNNFFAGTKYSSKVLKQMLQGDYHAFPESVKAFQNSGKITTIKGGDGIIRQMLKIPGSYKGKDGFFEFIKESNGIINHRLFNPSK